MSDSESLDYDEQVDMQVEKRDEQEQSKEQSKEVVNEDKEVVNEDKEDEESGTVEGGADNPLEDFYIFPSSPNSPFSLTPPSPQPRIPRPFLEEDLILTDLPQDQWLNTEDSVTTPVQGPSGHNNPSTLMTPTPTPNTSASITNPISPTPIPNTSSPPEIIQILPDLQTWEDEEDVEAILELGGWVHKGY